MLSATYFYLMVYSRLFMLLNVIQYIWILRFSCRFYFDFSPTYVGSGLICPRLVNCSVLLGAIISWGFLWLFVSSKAGDWYPAGLGSNDFKGLYGYKVLSCVFDLFMHILTLSHYAITILGGILLSNLTI